jgi:hypothetical protein
MNTMSSDRATVSEGRAVWERLKKNRTLEDYLKIGRALLVGRRFAMAKACTDEPKGGKYAKYFAYWIRDNGFGDMVHSARHCCLQLAQSEKGLLSWIETLPPTHRPRVYPQNVWQAYRVSVLKRTSKQDWRNRLQIDEETALQARDAARLAARDAARCQYISASTIEMLADAAFVATLNALDIAVPSIMTRPYTNGAARRAATAKPASTSPPPT